MFYISSSLHQYRVENQAAWVLTLEARAMPSASSRKECSLCVTCNASRKFLNAAGSSIFAKAITFWIRLTITSLATESFWSLAGLLWGVGAMLVAGEDAGLGEYRRTMQCGVHKVPVLWCLTGG